MLFPHVSRENRNVPPLSALIERDRTHRNGDTVAGCTTRLWPPTPDCGDAAVGLVAGLAGRRRNIATRHSRVTWAQTVGWPAVDFGALIRTVGDDPPCGASCWISPSTGPPAPDRLLPAAVLLGARGASRWQTAAVAGTGTQEHLDEVIEQSWVRLEHQGEPVSELTRRELLPCTLHR